MRVRTETKPVRQVDYCCEGMKIAEKGKAILILSSQAQIFGPNNDPVVIRGPIAYPIEFCPFCGARIIFEGPAGKDF
jgi:hypothetical protein